MLASQTKALHQLNKYYMERVQPRKMTINKSLCEIVQIVQDILKEVEAQEPASFPPSPRSTAASRASR